MMMGWVISIGANMIRIHMGKWYGNEGVGGGCQGLRVHIR